MKTWLPTIDSKPVKVMTVLIILQPFYDIFLYFLNTKLLFNSVFISLIRPSIALVFYVYLLIKKCVPAKLKVSSLLILFSYGIYSILHILNIKDYFYSNSYGKLIDEMRYLSVYGYFLLLLILIYFLYITSSTSDREALLKAFVFAVVLISALHLIAVLTGTSALTYSGKANKLGFKGWSVSAHYVGHSILLSLPIVIDVIFERRLVDHWYKYPLFLMPVISAYYVIGTKAPAYGLLIILFLYVLIKLIYVMFKKEKITRDLIFLVMLVLILAITLPFTLAGKNLQGQTIIAKSDTDFKIVDFITDNLEKPPDEHVRPDKNHLQLDDTIVPSFENRMTQSLRHVSSLSKKVIDNRQIQLKLNQHLFSISPLRDKVLGHGYFTMPKNTWVETDTFALLFSYGVLGVLIILGIPLLVTAIFALRMIRRPRYMKSSAWLYILGVTLGFGLVTVVGYTMFFAQTVFYFAGMLVFASISFQENVYREK